MRVAGRESAVRQWPARICSHRKSELSAASPKRQLKKWAEPMTYSRRRSTEGRSRCRRHRRCKNTTVWNRSNQQYQYAMTLSRRGSRRDLPRQRSVAAIKGSRRSRNRSGWPARSSIGSFRYSIEDRAVPMSVLHRPATAAITTAIIFFQPLLSRGSTHTYLSVVYRSGGLARGAAASLWTKL